MKNQDCIGSLVFMQNEPIRLHYRHGGYKVGCSKTLRLVCHPILLVGGLGCKLFEQWPCMEFHQSLLVTVRRSHT